MGIIFDLMAKSSKVEKLQAKAFGDGKESLSERVKKTATGSMGLLVGLAFAEVLFQSVSFIIQETAFLKQHQIIARILLALLLAALIARPWSRVILPMALLGEAEHEKAISQEVSQLQQV